MTAQTTPAKTRLAISAYAVLCFIYMLGSIAVRNVVNWHGFLVIGAVLLVWGAVLFKRYRNPRFTWHRMPKPLLLFLLLCALSIFWSAYRLETALGVAAQLLTTAFGVILATVLTWHELLRTFATALRYILGLSLVFELVVTFIIQEPVLQNFITVNNPQRPSVLLYWSHNQLPDGGPIQGIVANAALLGGFALFGLIVFAVQLRGGLVRPVKAWFWIAVAAAVLLLTQSATIRLALVVVGVTAFFVKWARLVGDKRRPVYIVGFLLFAATLTFISVNREWMVTALGKSRTLTGRTEIWAKVATLANEKPFFGWGWVSHWAPWAEPFKSLDTKNGLPVMHAHSALMDVRFQLGWVGVAIFLVLLLMTLQRLWCRAVDQPRRGVGAPLPYATSAVFPLLVFVALLVQSLTESRLLVEWGWLLLTIFAVKARIDYELPSKVSEPLAKSWRKVPILRQSQ